MLEPGEKVMSSKKELQEMAEAESQQSASPLQTVGEMILNPALIEQVGLLADRMAEAKLSVPAKLQGNPADCYAVAMQAIQWRMNPFTVAQKTHVINGQLAFEAQLVNAVVQGSGAIRGAFNYEYRGEGEDLECRVGAVLAGQNAITWGEWLRQGDVVTRNSPLWKTNPRQQIGYLQVKNFARAYCPAAILGVYTPDELQDAAPMREVGPGAAVSDLNASLKPDDGDLIEGEQVAEAVEMDASELQALLDAIKESDGIEPLGKLVADCAEIAEGGRASADQLDLLRAAIEKRKKELKAIADNDPAKQ